MENRGLRNILTVMKGETEEWDIVGNSVEPVQMRAEPEHCAFSWEKCQDILNRTKVEQQLESYKQYNRLCYDRNPVKIWP